MDSLVFAEFCEHLTEQFEKEEARENGRTSEIIPMDIIEKEKNLNDSMEKLPIPSSRTSQGSQDEDLLNLNDGNYLQPPKKTVV